MAARPGNLPGPRRHDENLIRGDEKMFLTERVVKRQTPAAETTSCLRPSTPKNSLTGWNYRALRGIGGAVVAPFDGLARRDTVLERPSAEGIQRQFFQITGNQVFKAGCRLAFTCLIESQSELQ